MTVNSNAWVSPAASKPTVESGLVMSTEMNEPGSGVYLRNCVCSVYAIILSTGSNIWKRKSSVSFVYVGLMSMITWKVIYFAEMFLSIRMTLLLESAAKAQSPT